MEILSEVISGDEWFHSSVITTVKSVSAVPLFSLIDQTCPGTIGVWDDEEKKH